MDRRPLLQFHAPQHHRIGTEIFVVQNILSFASATKCFCALIQSDRVPTRTLSKFSSTVPGFCKTVLALIYLWSGLALASALL